MSDSLRAALEKRLASLPVMAYGNGYLVEALPKAELLSLLAANPADAAPRPVIDREAVEADHYQVGRKAYVTDACACGWFGVKFSTHLLDAVMELARPMPTREQIEQAVHKAGIGSYRGIVADAVLALLTGGAE